MLRAICFSALYATTLIQHGLATALPVSQQVPLNQVLEKRTISAGPVIKNNFPDPCLIPANPNGSGGYYAFATRNIGSSKSGLPI